MATSRDSNGGTCNSSDATHPLQLGLASLILGGVLFLAAPMTATVAAVVWRFADTTASVVLLHAWLARAATLIGLVVGIASLSFGLSGIWSARQQTQRATLAWAGVLLGAAATLVWLIASIGLLNTTESLLRIHGQ